MMNSRLKTSTAVDHLVRNAIPMSILTGKSCYKRVQRDFKIPDITMTPQPIIICGIAPAIPPKSIIVNPRNIDPHNKKFRKDIEKGTDPLASCTILTDSTFATP
jgi:hypothetical protein